MLSAARKVRISGQSEVVLSVKAMVGGGSHLASLKRRRQRTRRCSGRKKRTETPGQCPLSRYLHVWHCLPKPCHRVGTCRAAEPACKNPGGADFCNEWTPRTLYLANTQFQPREEG